MPNIFNTLIVVDASIIDTSLGARLFIVMDSANFYNYSQSFSLVPDSSATNLSSSPGNQNATQGTNQRNGSQSTHHLTAAESTGIYTAVAIGIFLILLLIISCVWYRVQKPKSQGEGDVFAKPELPADNSDSRQLPSKMTREQPAEKDSQPVRLEMASDNKEGNKSPTMDWNGLPAEIDGQSLRFELPADGERPLELPMVDAPGHTFTDQGNGANTRDGLFTWYLHRDDVRSSSEATEPERHSQEAASSFELRLTDATP